MPTVKAQKPAKKKPTTKKKPVKGKTAKKGSGDFGSKITSLAEGLGEGLRINLYGISGTGKTTLWSTFPGRILALLCSSVDNTGELRSINTPECREKVSKHIVTSSEEIFEATEYVRQNLDEFTTIVLDHASGLQDLVLKEVLGLDEVPVQLSWGLATQQQWGQVAVQVKEYLRALLSLPSEVNVIIVAQERVFDDDGDTDLIAPNVASALSPSIVGWMNPAVDYIMQTYKRHSFELVSTKVGKKTVKKKKYTDETEFCLRIAPDAVYTTKFRKPKGIELPDSIVDPTYDKIKEYLSV